MIERGLAISGLTVFYGFRFNESIFPSFALQKIHVPLHDAAVFGNTPH
jgi:hypothetical protein